MKLYTYSEFGHVGAGMSLFFGERLLSNCWKEQLMTYESKTASIYRREVRERMGRENSALTWKLLQILGPGLDDEGPPLPVSCFSLYDRLVT